MGEEDKIRKQILYKAKKLSVFPFRNSGETPTPEIILRHLKMIEDLKRQALKKPD